MSDCLPVLALHGGAGTLRRADMTPERDADYRRALADILCACEPLLRGGESALEVVIEAVRLLEECPLFNAGKGAVLTAAGTHELDASVMDGRTLEAGAVAAVRRIRNPVLAAREVLRRSPHLLFAGEAADALAAGWGLEQVPPEWFTTPERLAQLQRAQALEQGARLDHDGAAQMASMTQSSRMGTVGAVALDARGHLAAATSTGGMTNKQPGRVGDTPVIGAGCYADDACVAVSCTGTGEAFIRICAAHDVAARMAYGGASLAEAAAAVIHQALPRVGGSGGLIAVSRQGEVALPFNSDGMYRGVVRAGSEPWVAIYGDE